MNKNTEKYLESLEKDNAQLRRMLWWAHNDGTAYGDDGEMQLWNLDFKRDSVHRLEEGILERSYRNYHKYLKSQGVNEKSCDMEHG
jgi:hypothetical protein